MKNFLSIHENEQAYEDAQNTFDYPHVAYLTTEDSLVYAETEPSPPHDYTLDYFTIEAIDDNLSFEIGDSDNHNVYYSSDGGETWTNGNMFTMNAGDKVMLKNNSYITQAMSGIMGKIYEANGGKYNVMGNIMSLFFDDDFVGQEDGLAGSDSVFYEMFLNSGVVDASNLVLPATFLEEATNCYASMFQGCTSLTKAPTILPATTLAFSCYDSMFNGCTSLTTAPELPATTLEFSCYNDMFNGCTSLATAPDLPATTLAPVCYNGMFAGCSSLTTAPELSATTLEYSCYESMFQGCTGLTTAPELPATTLPNSCYARMFSGCTSLNYIKMLATNLLSYGWFDSWVDGVAQSGTFVKDASMTTLPTGVNGIPTGWTVIDA